MSACERCWADAAAIYAAGRGRGESHASVYHQLLDERNNHPCTPEEQAGDWWDAELQIDRREGAQKWRT